EDQFRVALIGLDKHEEDRHTPILSPDAMQNQHNLWYIHYLCSSDSFGVCSRFVGFANSCSYSVRTFFSIICLVSLLSGWAMSLNVPSFIFLLGIATNSPAFPLITRRSLIKKTLSTVMVA